MGKKKNKRQQKGKPKGRHTPLNKHKKRGSRLHSPLSELAFNFVSWDRDLLPEHLWIVSLALTHGIDSFHLPYGAFLDAVDEFWPEEEKSVCLGLLSDFELLPQDKREGFLAAHEDLARDLFWDPIGPALELYPDCPARWLLDALRRADDSIDPERGLGTLRGLVRELLGGRGDLATRVRVATLTRPLKHGKMYFMEGASVMPDLLPRYPHDLDEDEKAMAESLVRGTMGPILATRENLSELRWPKHFWRQNHRLTICRPVDWSPPVGMRLTDADDLELLESAMQAAAQAVRAYLDLLTDRVPLDLYEPRKDEILFGLFARASRMLILLLEDPLLWARDVGSILLRCLADTAITFVYLVSKGTDADFARFFEYGEGQQKLLMLHLQDHYPDQQSPEGFGAEDVEKGLTVLPEFIDIELGHWAGKDARRLAQEAGLERHYRLVFSPASSDVHGSWLSLKNTHLTYCDEPLHRYHRLPHLAEPPFFVNVVETARELFEECRAAAIKQLGYPAAEPTESFLDNVGKAPVS